VILRAYNSCKRVGLPSWGGVVPVSWFEERSLRERQWNESHSDWVRTQNRRHIIRNHDHCQRERREAMSTIFWAEWSCLAAGGWCQWADLCWGPWARYEKCSDPQWEILKVDHRRYLNLHRWSESTEWRAQKSCRVWGGLCQWADSCSSTWNRAAMKAMNIRAENRFWEGVQIFELREVAELWRDCAIELIII